MQRVLRTKVMGSGDIVRIPGYVFILDEKFKVRKTEHGFISTTALFFHCSLMTNGKRLQGFDCLLKLVNEDIDNLLPDIVTKSEYIALKCVHLLEMFGPKYSVGDFQKCNKMQILKRISSTNARNPRAMELIVHICIGYDIYEASVWNGLLKQMVNLNMHKELAMIIDMISTKSSLIHLDGLAAAWEYLISIRFKTINKTRSYEQDAEMCKALFMLQSCPIRSKINLMKLVQICIQFNQIHVAGVFIAFASDEQSAHILKVIALVR